ncbi:hypothetical protein KSS87_008865 [Heliosperma pusillum]|nr:hypothetical protein KSS87_008865 [Heliosperma pusillum]
MICQGKLSCLMINDIDAGIGRFGDTQVTVNNQIVSGTLMNLADNPTRVSIGQNWRESDITHRIPIIVTGNDFTTIYAPLVRDGRMEKFYWQPNHEDIVNIVCRMYEKDGIGRDEVISIVNTFPNQALDFYGALRSRTYDQSVLKWVEDIGGAETLGAKLLRQRKGEKLPVFVPPEDNFFTFNACSRYFLTSLGILCELQPVEAFVDPAQLDALYTHPLMNKSVGKSSIAVDSPSRKYSSSLSTTSPYANKRSTAVHLINGDRLNLCSIRGSRRGAGWSSSLTPDSVVDDDAGQGRMAGWLEVSSGWLKVSDAIQG